ncbi:ceramidase [Rhodobacteraceae bacterium]|nr:ceramidase [Paracoccaceae bacterium]
MDWTRTIDAYCERVDPSFWAEPINAVTNLAFLIAGFVMWRRTIGLIGGRVLSVVLFAIGVGSFLFHTFATGWAAALDTTPILAFVLIYLFLSNRDFWGLPWWAALLGTLAYVPYAALITPVFKALPFFEVSSFYWSLPVLIGGYAVLLRRRTPATARGLAIGAGVLCLSLIARSVDDSLCPALPFGTHFLWHVLNAVMLAWMIEVWARHVRMN